MIQIHYNIYYGKRNPRFPKISENIQTNLTDLQAAPSLDKNPIFGYNIIR